MRARAFLDASSLDAAIQVWAGTREVIGPVVRCKEDTPRLEKLPSREQIILGPRKPLLPLKTLFLPPAEPLFSFAHGAQGIMVTPARALLQDRLILGALGCDLAALEILDQVFLDEPVDEAYRERRERSTIVALACFGEGPECFCASLGIDPLRPTGADAWLTLVESGYMIESLSEKGERIMQCLGDILREPRGSAKEASPARSSSRRDVFISTPREGWSGTWDAPFWEELAARCLGCGICTLLCPTCHCFDVQDERQGCRGGRYRAWDSCIFSDFTQMAGGDNPRALHGARFRQRFLHKLVYFHQRKGVLACVGCGRCQQSCPIGIGIEEVAALIDRAGSAG